MEHLYFSITIPCTLQQLKQKAVIAVLKHTDGNRAKAARLLGVDYQTIRTHEKESGYVRGPKRARVEPAKCEGRKTAAGRNDRRYGTKRKGDPSGASVRTVLRKGNGQTSTV